MDDRDSVYPGSAEPDRASLGGERPQEGDAESDAEGDSVAPADVGPPTRPVVPPAPERVRILGAEPAAEVTAVLPVVRRDDPARSDGEAGEGPSGAGRPGTVRLTGEPVAGSTTAAEPVRPGETVLPGDRERVWSDQEDSPTPSGAAALSVSDDQLTAPDDPAPAAPVLPHWTDPPTGQVPAVLSRGHDDRGAMVGPVWREEHADWEAHDNEYEPAMLVEDEPALGSLDESDTPDPDRRPWEFDLPGDARVADQDRDVTAPGAEPLVSPWDVDERDRSRDAAVGGPERVLGRSGADGEREPAGGPESGEERGEGLLAGAAIAGSALAGAAFGHDEDGDELPEIGRFRRGGLRSRRPTARRPTNVPEDLEPPLAAEPPGAAITEVPGVGLRRGGIAGLAAADRDAHPEEPDSGSEPARRRLRTKRSGRGRRARREESAWWSDVAGGDEPGRSESVEPERTGVEPPTDPVSDAGSSDRGEQHGAGRSDPGSTVATGAARVESPGLDPEPVAIDPEPGPGAAGVPTSEPEGRVAAARGVVRPRSGQSGGGPPLPRPRSARRRPDRAGSRSGTPEVEPGSRSGVGVRIATGIAAAAVALALFSAGAVPSLVLVVVVVVFAAGEAFGVLRRAGYRPATLLGLVGIAVLMVGAYLKGPAAVPPILAAIGAFTLLWYLFGVESGPPVAGSAATLLVVVWVGVLGSFAALLLAPSADPHREGIAFLLGAVIATVANDVGGLLVGGWIGRHPLAPRVSPHKTWEGLVGGLVLTVGVSAGLVGAIHPWTPEKAAILGLVVSVIAPLGDLCESMLKRDLLVKDMGNLLPGHGGVLDRIDAMLFVLPVTYYLVHALHLA